MPRTILFLHSSAGRYGADRQLALITGGLDRRRFRPVVVLPQDGPLVVDLEAAGVEVIVRPLAVLRRGLLHPSGLAGLAAAVGRDARELGRLIRDRDVALVHSNTSVVLGGAAAAGATRRPHVWHVREIYARFGPAWPVYRRLLLSARALPCVSAATAVQFKGHDRVRVVPDGLAVMVEPAPRAVARAALGIPSGPPAIAVLGRIADWKGQDVLIRALATPELRQRGTLALLAGDPWPGNEERLDAVLDLAQALGVRDRVHVLGFRPDVENVLGAAEIVAVPSTAPDPLPGSATEAAAAGCAVIAAAHGGLPEIIQDRVSGRLVAPGDPAALATAAEELLQDPGERARLGRAARERTRQRFAPERLLDSIHALYGELLG